MKQGVLTNKRVRLLLGKNQSCYRPRRKVCVSPLPCVLATDMSRERESEEQY